MLNPEHCGLYFTKKHILRARKYRSHLPYSDAWNMLLNTEQTVPLAVLQWGGLRYRFDDNVDAGEEVLPNLNADMFTNAIHESLLGGTTEFRDVVCGVVALSHCFELLHDHPAYTRQQRARWLGLYSDFVGDLRLSVKEPTALETFWLGTLNIVAGIVLENKDWFDTGVAVFQHAINDSIHPEGYVLSVVDVEDGRSLEYQISAVMALVLSAEAASHVGTDLWDHRTRGVSVLTAAAYPLYYYFYPETWPWDADDITQEQVTRIFMNYGGFLEIINGHYERPLRAIRLILDDLRPVYHCHGGGLTTLSHASSRRGLFG